MCMCFWVCLWGLSDRCTLRLWRTRDGPNQERNKMLSESTDNDKCLVYLLYALVGRSSWQIVYVAELHCVCAVTGLTAGHLPKNLIHIAIASDDARLSSGRKYNNNRIYCAWIAQVLARDKYKFWWQHENNNANEQAKKGKCRNICFFCARRMLLRESSVDSVHHRHWPAWAKEIARQWLQARQVWSMIDEDVAPFDAETWLYRLRVFCRILCGFECKPLRMRKSIIFCSLSFSSCSLCGLSAAVRCASVVLGLAIRYAGVI